MLVMTWSLGLAWACDPPSRRECDEFLAPAEVQSGGKVSVELSEVGLGVAGHRRAQFVLPFEALEAVYQACSAAQHNPRDPHVCAQWESARTGFIERYLGMELTAPPPQAVPGLFRNCLDRRLAYLQDARGFAWPDKGQNKMVWVPPGPYRLVIDGTVVQQVQIQPGTTQWVSPAGQWESVAGSFTVSCKQ
jgi:hypothetical protein